MRPLIINQADVYGGAALAGYALHQGLRRHGLESRMLVGTASRETDDIKQFRPVIGPVERMLQRVASHFSLHNFHQLSTRQVAQHPFYREADVVHLHNFRQPFSYLALPRLTRHKPTLWTLHDMWAFTGHCSFSYECERWASGCGQCPHLDVFPAMEKDYSALEHFLKNQVYRFSKLAIVTPSRWLADVARRSILGRFPVHHIPNGIDLATYHPIDQSKARAVIGVDWKGPVVLIAADRLNDTRKGFDLVLKSIAQLKSETQKNLLLLSFGHDGDTFLKNLPCRSLDLGPIQDENRKAQIYAAADLFILPSRADNLPMVLMESLACGVPALSTLIGGIPEMVVPGETGELIAGEDSAELTRRLEEMLFDLPRLKNFGRNARLLMEKEYSIEQSISRHIQLYESLLRA